VDSVWMDFSKTFDRVRHQLLLEEMYVGILWLKKFMSGGIQRIRIGDVVCR
jgi:hypothetical protein